MTHLSDRGRTAATAEVSASTAATAAAGRAGAALDDDGADLEALAARAAPSPAPSAPTLSLANGVGNGLVEVHALRLGLGSLHRVLRHGVNGILRLSVHGRVVCGRARAGNLCRARIRSDASTQRHSFGGRSDRRLGERLIASS